MEGNYNNQEQNYNPNGPQGYQHASQNPQNYNPNGPQGYQPANNNQQNYNPNDPQGNQQQNQNYVNQNQINVNMNNYNNNNNYPNQQVISQEVYQFSKDQNAHFETGNYMAALEGANFAFIKQKIELMEVFTGCETKNRYKVFIRYPDGRTLYLFKAKEDSGCCERQCCR